jgi:hypothetical protein
MEQQQKYSWLLPSLEKAKLKWRSKNRAKLSEKSREYYQAHKNDETFRAKCRERSRCYYQQKKAQLASKKDL